MQARQSPCMIQGTLLVDAFAFSTGNSILFAISTNQMKTSKLEVIFFLNPHLNELEKENFTIIS